MSTNARSQGGSTLEPTREQYTIVTAVEGGINYWAERVSYVKADPSIRVQDDRFITNLTGIKFYDPEEDKEFVLTAAQLRAATNKIVEDHTLTGAHIRRYIVSDDIDADAADCIVQVAAFGKLVYG